MRRSALIGLAAVLIAGCGGGGLSKSELIRQGDALCVKQGAIDNRIGGFRDAKSLVSKGDQLLAADRAGLEAFSKLKPPDELQGAFDAYVQVLRMAMDTEAQLIGAAKKGDKATLRQANLTIQELRPKLTAAARKVGFKSCSRASG